AQLRHDGLGEGGDRGDRRPGRGPRGVPPGGAQGLRGGAPRPPQPRRVRQPDPERLHLQGREGEAPRPRRGQDERAREDLRAGVAVLDVDARGVPRSRAVLLFRMWSGVTVSFGLARFVNLAHGAFYLLGGYLGLATLHLTGSFWL